MNHMQQIVRHFQDMLGLKLYLVGGSVRDRLLGIPHADLDFATPASPDEIEAAIRNSGRKAFITGKRFGTIAFNYKPDPNRPNPKDPHSSLSLRAHPSESKTTLLTLPTNPTLIEITTFRTETYGKSRKPEVEFVHEITQDLSRRDFTVNAMAVGDEGKLIDPFSGYADLQAEKIRFVGNPSVRINEDPLRMLRACRLSAQFQFVPTTETKEKIKENAVKILRISHERWTQELDKILVSSHPHRGLDALAQTELLRFILPEIWIQYHYDQNSPYHRLSLFEHTKKAVQLVKKDVNIRWAALLHDVGKPFARIDKPSTQNVFTIEGMKETVRRFWHKNTQSNYPYHSELGAELTEKIGKHLRWSNDRIKITKEMVLHHLSDESPIDKADSAAR